MKKLTTLALALGSAIVMGQAHAYKYQIDAAYDYYDLDQTGLDQGAFSVQGTAYFEPIQVKDFPLQEAAFLTQTNNLYAAYQYSYVDFSLADIETNTDIHDVLGGFEYFNRTSGLYFNASLGRATIKAEAREAGVIVEDGEANQTHYRAEVGFMPQHNLLFAAGVSGYKATGDQDDTGVALRAKYVMPLAEGRFLNLEAAGEFNDADQLQLNADYYLDPTWSVGASYSLEDNGVDDVDYFAIRTKKFFNPQLAVGAKLGFGDDVTTIGLEGSYRF